MKRFLEAELKENNTPAYLSLKNYKNAHNNQKVRTMDQLKSLINKSKEYLTAKKLMSLVYKKIIRQPMTHPDNIFMSEVLTSEKPLYHYKIRLKEKLLISSYSQRKGHQKVSRKYYKKVKFKKCH